VPGNGIKPSIKDGYIVSDGTTITLLLTIKTRKKEIQIPMDKVANARLAVTF
ncbi:ribosome maturation factor RimP, partial [Bacillus sp. D-CC]